MENVSQNLEYVHTIDNSIRKLVGSKLNLSRDSIFDKIETDTFGEIIDKLIIVHIRYWYLEDKMSDESLSDSELAALRRKSESLFKSKRPMLVNALDKSIFNLITNGDLLVPENVKLYKGWNS
jgi:hypothetical protein